VIVESSRNEDSCRTADRSPAADAVDLIDFDMCMASLSTSGLLRDKAYGEGEGLELAELDRDDYETDFWGEARKGEAVDPAQLDPEER
jgi:hypothetical protein